MALMALGRYPEAEKYFQARLDSLKGAAWPQKEVDAVLNLGKIYQAAEAIWRGQPLLPEGIGIVSPDGGPARRAGGPARDRSDGIQTE